MPPPARLRALPQLITTTLLAAGIVASVLLGSLTSCRTPEPPPTVGVTLTDAGAASALASHLPVTLTFTNRMGTAVLATGTTSLTVSDIGDPSRAYRAGDIAYIATERTLVVFLNAGSAVPDHGILLLGQVTQGFDHFARCARECTIQLAPHQGEGAQRGLALPPAMEGLR